MNFSYWALKQNGSHFADDGIFKCNFLRENVCILFQYHLKLVPRCQIDNMSWMVLVLNQSWPSSQLHITRLQCVNQWPCRNLKSILPFQKSLLQPGQARVSGDLQSFFSSWDIRGSPQYIKMLSFQHRDPHVKDYKNPLHLDVVDRYLRRMGNKTIPDEAPPSLELFYPPWVAGIDLPQSRCCGFFVSFTNKHK